MHDQVKHFTEFVKSLFPEYFVEKNVFDIGSGDINGNNRYLFKDCEYGGNDVTQAANVTIVSKTKDLPFADNTFDTIISTECFEHDPEYKQSFEKIYRMLKPNGLFCFTCASTGRGEHGTRRTSPQDSYGTLGGLEDMADYYKNLTEKDVNAVLPFNDLFACWNTYYNMDTKDLYFYGIKRSSEHLKDYSNITEYSARSVLKTSSAIYTCS